MWNLFYRNSRLLIITIFIIIFWGVSSLFVLPRMEDPAVSQWYGKITTHFPGASAERVESLVTEKLEQKLSEIEEIKFIESTSQLGNSLILIKLQNTVKNHDEVWSRVRDHLADITPQLPPGVLAPKYEEISQRAYTLIVALTWDNESPTNYAILNRLAEELEQRLYNVGSTEEIKFWGASSEEILVEINPTDLAALGLTPQQLSQQIRLSDSKVSSGQLHSSKNDLLIEVETELDSLERIRQIPIRVGNNSEQLVRLGDIAEVKKTIQEPPNELAIINGKPGITLGVLIEPNKRIDLWMRDARETLEKFRKSSISPGIGLEIILDQNHYVEKRLNNLFKNLLLGAVLIMTTTAFLMGGKSSLVIGFSLPLSVLMVFGGMRLLEIPLHQMSLTGLVIALGMLIDNAIVVVDEMEHLLREGWQPHRAISQAVSNLAIPLLASTLTTVLTFLPIALLTSDVGEYLRTIALSVILALGSSLLLSLTVIPAIRGRMRQKAEKHYRTLVWWSKGFSNSQLTKVYRHTLDYIIATPTLGIMLAFILPVTGFLMAGSIPEQFFPPAERDQFQIELELPLSTSIEQTQSVVETATVLIRQHSEVINLHWFLGSYAPAFYYNLAPFGVKGEIPYYAAAMVQISAGTSSRQMIQTLQRELNQACPQARVLVKQLEQGPQGPPFAPIEFRLIGSNLDTLQKLGNQARTELVGVGNVTHTYTSLGEALPKLGLSIDEEQAQLAGLDNTQIAQQLNAYLEGNRGGSILEDTEELPVRVRLANSDRANLNQITTLDLVPNNQSSLENTVSLPLSAFGQINLVPETAIITRRNGQRVNTVYGFITAGVLPSNVLADFQQRLNDSNFQLPPGYSVEWGGKSAARNEAVSDLLSTVGILIFLIVAMLVLSFKSFRSASIIFLVAIGSVGLALASLWFFGYPLGFMAIMGTMGLIGVAINDSIVVLAAIRNDPQARKGNRRAMVKMIIRSTRHVLTTTITTVMGFIPLFLDGGEFWPPLAICIAGGVSGATLLALFFVPCAYLLLIERNHLNYLKLSRKQNITSIFTSNKGLNIRK